MNEVVKSVVVSKQFSLNGRDLKKIGRDLLIVAGTAAAAAALGYVSEDLIPTLKGEGGAIGLVLVPILSSAVAAGWRFLRDPQFFE